MPYEFPDASPSRFIPLNKTIVVLEDPTLYERTKVFHVRDEAGVPMTRDGEAVILHTIEKYDGAERIPDVRRAKIVAISERMKSEGVAWKTHVLTGHSRSEETVYIKGVKKTHVRNVPQYDFRERVDYVPPVGTVVWYASRNVARQKFQEGGVEYTLIGAHQIDFIESESSGLEFHDIDPLGAPVK